MGEPLYEEVVGAAKLNRPCRIYAPVGTHETLLAYLVRRLLENGANSSFVNRIQDANVPIAELAADPVAQVAAKQPVGAPHPKILKPRQSLRPWQTRIPVGLDLIQRAAVASNARCGPEGKSVDSNVAVRHRPWADGNGSRRLRR